MILKWPELFTQEDHRCLGLVIWICMIPIDIVVGMGGINKYKEIKLKIYGWTGNLTRDPCITSQVLYHWAIHDPSSPNYHIPPPLQSLRPRRHTQQTQVHPIRTYQIQMPEQGRPQHPNVVGRNEKIQRNTNENIWLDWESNPGPLHH